jgi:hypothetical protein
MHYVGGVFKGKARGKYSYHSALKAEPRTILTFYDVTKIRPRHTVMAEGGGGAQGP